MPLDPQEPRAAELAVDEAGFRWPLAFMRREQFRKGEYLFKIGDPADKLFYIARGLIRLPELDRVMRAGQVIGEVGIFSPDRSRSASALAQEDVETYAMGSEEVRSLMSRDPVLATGLVEVILKRMLGQIKAETEARERVNAELRIARNIQASMLPRVFPPFPGRKDFELYGMMEPAMEVGGDFYDFFLIEENKLCLIIGDVSGKGVAAALFMALAKTLLRSEALREGSPSEVLARVNNSLCQDNNECMFSTVFYATVDTLTGKAECCSAGHNPPLVCASDGAIEAIKVEPGLLLGFEKDSRCQPGTLCLKPGDMLFLYTDGVIEAENPDQEPYSEERLRASIHALRFAGPQELVSGVRQDIARHARGHPQSDDITMLAFRYAGRAGGK